jgi:ssDNA-binding Zn-finger/Zn-ribbon topoisomerase 1
MGKKPRFFCGNCGTEVGRNAKTCPKCGRFFASIRCPKCNHSADDAAFKKGCPVCGYAIPLGNAAYSQGEKVPAGKLRLWVYILSVCAFIAAVALLIIKIVK